MGKDKAVAVLECVIWFIVHRRRRLFLGKDGAPCTIPNLFGSYNEARLVLTEKVHPALQEDWSVIQSRLTWCEEARP
jgi:hypothetical protein